MVYTNVVIGIYGSFAMTIYVKDPETSNAVRELAKLKGKTLTETIREAIDHEHRRTTERQSVADKINELAERLQKYPRTGLEADKAFYDELSGDI